jgi:translocation and assembly module TamA
MRATNASCRRGAAFPAGLVGLLAWLAGPAPGLAAAADNAPRPKVKVEVEGVKGELKKNVLANLSIEQEKKAKDLDEQRIRRLHAQAVDDISEALQPFGYYKPVVQATLTHQGSDWVARYVVDPGPQLKVTHRDLQLSGPGGADPDFQAVVASFPLHEGDPLDELAYEAGKKSLEDYAADHGYLDGTYREKQIRIDLATYTADIVLHYESGPRYRYGPVTFEQSFLDPKLLQGYITFHEGQPISASELLRFQTELAASNYFQRVEVVPRRDLAQGDQVPIVVTLVAAPHQRWTAGVGYGTDTGPRATGGLELRRVDRHGDHALIEATGSNIERSFHTDFVVPGAYPRTDTMTFTLAYQNLHTKTSKSESELAGGVYAQSIGRWRQALKLNYERTTYTVGVDSGVSTLVRPQAVWTRVWADDRIFPTHGERLEADVGAAHKSLLSNASFVQEHVSGKFIGSLKDRRFRLISRAEIGYTEISDHDFHLLPPTVRYFAGGDQSVRGYAYQALGPRDQFGHVLGGRSLLVGSVELEYRFLKKWGVAVFYDAGNAARNFSFSLKQGTGFGLRWLSPIGMVRADLAFAVSEPGRPLRLHLNIGPDL